MDEEVEVINSIYEDYADLSPETFTVTLKLSNEHDISVKLWYPLHYPEEAPRVVSVSGLSAARDAARQLQKVIEDQFQPGEGCLFTLIQESEPLVEEMLAQDEIDKKKLDAANATVDYNSVKGSVHVNEWSLTGEYKDRGSTFIGRAVRANSEKEVQDLFDDLMDDKKVAKASLKMAAWRVPTSVKGVLAEDFDDGGEAGAGSCILHIMQLLNAENALVVVCRYFGGVHIGPDRFKYVKQCTRDAVIAAGLSK